MNQIVINDTETFLDLYTASILDAFLSLPCDFYTTDFVLAELRKEKVWDTVNGFVKKRLLHYVTFAFEDIVKIRNLQKLLGKTSQDSFSDYAGAYFAKLHGFVLLASPHTLQRFKQLDGVYVRGMQYAIDALNSSGGTFSEDSSKRFASGLSPSPQERQTRNASPYTIKGATSTILAGCRARYRERNTAHNLSICEKTI